MQTGRAAQANALRRNFRESTKHKIDDQNGFTTSDINLYGYCLSLYFDICQLVPEHERRARHIHYCESIIQVYFQNPLVHKNRIFLVREAHDIVIIARFIISLRLPAGCIQRLRMIKLWSQEDGPIRGLFSNDVSNILKENPAPTLFTFGCPNLILRFSFLSASFLGPFIHALLPISDWKSYLIIYRTSVHITRKSRKSREIFWLVWLYFS
ncbi:hypothetical protein METSCH_C08530 [Metschnikowia aff. pulcherrima]|uniref:Uncharacterized protein n=1 Tax=Metschnikowia aff. pulcherrima TaxID=2163413 RepID=A0A4P6XN40_9ASCO|nr:hypothetical protein METSCH_C08530 [Metschnikowia aff. pulcherrima]